LSLYHFSFGSPYFLVALVLVPLLFVYTARVRRRRPRYVVSFTNLNVLGGLPSAGRRPWWRRWPLILLALALATSSAALARPSIELTASDRGTTVVLLVDISGSMQAVDVGTQRLSAAVTAMHNFLQEFPDGDKVGLVSFSDKVQILQPPTTDHAAVDASIDTLKPQGGTALGTGVQVAVKLLVSTLAADGIHHVPGKYLPAAIVLESDGAQNRGTVSPFQAAELARAAGIRIYGVALGKKRGYITQGTGFFALKIPAPPDPGVVGLLARKSGGKAFAAASAPAIDKIYRDLGSSIGRHPQATEITSWFELAAAVFLVSSLVLARARGAALP
jgi:Ca-activated chloride channel family protein